MILIQHYRDNPMRAQALFSNETSFCNIKSYSLEERWKLYLWYRSHNRNSKLSHCHLKSRTGYMTKTLQANYQSHHGWHLSLLFLQTSSLQVIHEGRKWLVHTHFAQLQINWQETRRKAWWKANLNEAFLMYKNIMFELDSLSSKYWGNIFKETI